MRKFLTFVSFLLIALAPVAARAHAFLDHSSPLVGSTVATAPHEVVMTFTQNLEPAFSTAQVTNPAALASTRARRRSAATP